MNFLKKYIITILLIFSLACNSASISRNVNQLNSVAVGVGILAECVDTVATNLTKLAYEIAILKITNNNNNTSTLELFKVFVEGMKSQQETIETIKNTQDVLVEEVLTKPSFKYLRSVTVYIVAKEKDELDLLIERACFALGKERALDHIKPDWLGTGVVVKVDSEYTYILTNKHVAGGDNCYFEDGTQKTLLMISDDGKNRKSAEIVKLHNSEDLALIKVYGVIKGKQAIKGVVYPEITDKAFTVGQSLGRMYLYGEGYYSGTDEYNDTYQLPVLPGCSGSGLFNKDGYLTGLIYSMNIFRLETSIQGDITHANAIKGIYIKEFLEQNLI